MLSIIFLGGGTAPLIKYITGLRIVSWQLANKRRTVQHTEPHTELRILICIYHQENVTSILSLLESTHRHPDHPVCLYVLHLIELAGRAAPVLAPYKKRSDGHRKRSSAATIDTEHIVNAFNYFVQQCGVGAVSVLPFVSVAPYATMHDDICSLALDKKVSLILAPFHKHLAIDGSQVALNPAIQNVNVNVLHYAPCSVGIHIYDGVTSTGKFGSAPTDMYRVALYFIGGPDDREALAYGIRMAQDLSVGLTLVRFLPPREEREEGKEEKLDALMVEEFKASMVDGSRVLYREEIVVDGEGTVAVIRAMSGLFNLLIVGRREGQESRLTAGLSMWSEYPESGIVGDLLASSTDSEGKVATLVVQQQTRFHSEHGGGSPKVQHKGKITPVQDFDTEQ